MYFVVVEEMGVMGECNSIDEVDRLVLSMTQERHIHIENVRVFKGVELSIEVSINVKEGR